MVIRKKKKNVKKDNRIMLIYKLSSYLMYYTQEYENELNQILRKHPGIKGELETTLENNPEYFKKIGIPNIEVYLKTLIMLSQQEKDEIDKVMEYVENGTIRTLVRRDIELLQKYSLK